MRARARSDHVHEYTVGFFFLLAQYVERNIIRFPSFFIVWKNGVNSFDIFRKGKKKDSRVNGHVLLCCACGWIDYGWYT